VSAKNCEQCAVIFGKAGKDACDSERRRRGLTATSALKICYAISAIKYL